MTSMYWGDQTDCLQLLNVFSDVGAIVGLAGMTWDYLPAA